MKTFKVIMSGLALMVCFSAAYASDATDSMVTTASSDADAPSANREDINAVSTGSVDTTDQFVVGE